MGHLLNWFVIFICLLVPAGIVIGFLGYLLGQKLPNNAYREVIVSASMLFVCILYFIALFYIFT